MSNLPTSPLVDVMANDAAEMAIALAESYGEGRRADQLTIETSLATLVEAMANRAREHAMAANDWVTMAVTEGNGFSYPVVSAVWAARTAHYRAAQAFAAEVGALVDGTRLQNSHRSAAAHSVDAWALETAAVDAYDACDRERHSWMLAQCKPVSDAGGVVLMVPEGLAWDAQTFAFRFTGIAFRDADGTTYESVATPPRGDVRDI